VTGTEELLLAAAVARLELASAGTGRHGLSVAVVVDDFAPEPFIRATIDFALAVPEEVGAAWHRAFTRTIFLAGRPETVARRHPGAFRSAEAALGWYGPAPAAQLRNLSRMLRAFQGPAPIRPSAEALTVRVPGAAAGHPVEAAVATDGVSVAEYLVHVHHLFAEATLRGLIRPGDTVHVTHRGELDGPWIRDALDPASADFVQTRITHDSHDADRLRLYAVLASNSRGGLLCTPNAS
jgi:hypothetical protein